MEHIRELINAWIPTLIALLGLLMAWDKASHKLRAIWSHLNLYRRVHTLEADVGEIEASVLHLERQAGIEEEA